MSTSLNSTGKHPTQRSKNIRAIALSQFAKDAWALNDLIGGGAHGAREKTADSVSAHAAKGKIMYPTRAASTFNQSQRSIEKTFRSAYPNDSFEY